MDAASKWSRRVATMLPWLVIPLLGFWALSHLLPPAFHFEITSPRVACVVVLFFTLFWYEVLMPQLSSWRERRSARLREKKRLEAIEMQKMKKAATRRCRNCLTPYRDQNPAGGKFMCSYCGHLSKKPVLDLPVPPGIGMTNSEKIKNLVSKGVKMTNGKVWSENSWMCGQDWLDNGNWVDGSFSRKSTYWKNSQGDYFGREEDFMYEKSYFGIVTLFCKLLHSFYLSIKWLLRKIFRFNSSIEDDLLDADRRVSKGGENESELHESRSDKARRKAEEKRQARLEKELLEEEERKQREEVARLVEERRRIRYEKTEAEKDRESGGSGLAPVKEKVSKKETEKKRQERRKAKDKGSSKSNSDIEELEKKACKESYSKMEFDKKRESVKTYNTNNSYTRNNAGSRYLDRMKGRLLSSSKAFGGGFFGRSGSSSTSVPKENRPGGFVDHAQSSTNKRELHQQERFVGKVNINADDKHGIYPVHTDPRPTTPPLKKSWQQLFTPSATDPPPSNTNVISRPLPKIQTELQSPQLSNHFLSTQPYDNPINFGVPSPFTLSNLSNGPTITSSSFPSLNESMMFPRISETPHELLSEESELFEDPCYVPDPVWSLLGPVSESLDDFQLNIGAGFVNNPGFEKPRCLKNVIDPSEANKLSPIESPLSRLKSADNSKSLDTYASTLFGDSKSPKEKGTWQMWDSSLLGQDGLGLIGGPGSCLSPPEKNRPNMEEYTLFQNGGFFTSHVGSFYPSSSSSENNFIFNPKEETTKNEVVFGSRNTAVNNRPFELTLPNCWPKKEWIVKGSGEEEGIGKTLKQQQQPHIGLGGIYSTPNVQSLWSYE